jgi:hypothetical protein
MVSATTLAMRVTCLCPQIANDESGEFVVVNPKRKRVGRVGPLRLCDRNLLLGLCDRTVTKAADLIAAMDPTVWPDTPDELIAVLPDELIAVSPDELYPEYTTPETCKTVHAKLDPEIADATKLMLAGLGLTIPCLLSMKLEIRMQKIMLALTQYAMPPKCLVVFCATASRSLASRGTCWSEMGNTLMSQKLHCTKQVGSHWRCQPLGGIWILDPAVVDHDQLELAKCEDYFISCTI